MTMPGVPGSDAPMALKRPPSRCARYHVDGRRAAEVRVVGQQRLARGRARAGDDPVVAGGGRAHGPGRVEHVGRESAQRVRLRPGASPRQAGPHHAAGCPGRRAGRRRAPRARSPANRSSTPAAAPRPLPAPARATMRARNDLVAVVGAERQRHHLRPDEHVGRRPRRGLEPEDRELHGQTAGRDASETNALMPATYASIERGAPPARGTARPAAAARWSPSVLNSRSVAQRGLPQQFRQPSRPSRRWNSICQSRSCACTYPRPKSASASLAAADVRDAELVAQRCRPRPDTALDGDGAARRWAGAIQSRRRRRPPPPGQQQPPPARGAAQPLSHRGSLDLRASGARLTTRGRAAALRRRRCYDCPPRRCRWPESRARSAATRQAELAPRPRAPRATIGGNERQ